MKLLLLPKIKVPTMSTPPQYSTLLSTLYDEQAPIGELGRGTHYSILRSTTSYADNLEPSAKINVHDFALIWDEDHDTRVIDAIEMMYVRNLLSPVLFLGERKGGLTTLVDPLLYNDQEKQHTYMSEMAEICGSLPDSWSSTVNFFDPSMPMCTEEPRMLINSGADKIDVYLKNINNLWNLGIKKYKPSIACV